MKKVFLAIITIISVLLVSCNSIDSKINKLEKACKVGDQVKALKIASELEKQEDKLTEEQQIRILRAAELCAESASSQMKDIDESDDF